MDLNNKCQVTTCVLFVMAIVVSDTAPLDHVGCAHSWRLTHIEGNKSSSSSPDGIIKSTILTSLGKVQLDVEEKNFSSTDSVKLDGIELALFQKLLNAISKHNKEEIMQRQVNPQEEQRVTRCGKRCRRRRRHNRKQKNSSESSDTLSQQPSLLRPLRTDPRILKSNNPAVVITKDSNILRKDWCKTEPLQQQIREPGCRPKTIVNNFCYGQCNSFFIPNGEVSDDSGSKRGGNSSTPDFKSCAVCKPRLTSWVKVTLRCPGMIPPTRTKRVMRVHKCRCQTELSR